MTPREALLALNSVPDCGPITIRKLLDHFQSPVDILSAPINKLTRVNGIGERIAGNIVNWHQTFSIEDELKKIEKHSIEFITILDEEYPVNLKAIYDPPIILYIKGTLVPSDKNAIGVVGTRRATNYGRESAAKLSRQLAQAGVTIVSGLARGIDTAAHRATIEAGGRTIAVLGCGLSQMYPPENKEIANQVAQSGAVISEFPMDVSPQASHFPRRNRVVSGLSLGVLIAEAPKRSGALLTANQALDQNRHVFAVPGRIDMPSFSGNHYLLKQGAQLVESVDDILDEFEFLFPSEKAKIFNVDREKTVEANLTDEEKAVYKLLSLQEVGIENIIDQTGLPAHTVSTTLLHLELKKLARQLPGKQFVKQAVNR
jgi:DNA processing protein